jgi:hypothetical protein
MEGPLRPAQGFRTGHGTRAESCTSGILKNSWILVRRSKPAKSRWCKSTTMKE